MAEENIKKSRAPRIKEDAVINLLKDDKGVVYGPENNPKRKSSKARERFVHYRDGLTVAEAKAAGLTAADIAYDREHGYISLTDVPVAAEKVAA